MSATNKSVLAAAGLLLCAAVGTAVWRDKAPAVTENPVTASAPNDIIASLEKAVKDNPEKPEAWSALAAGLFDLGKFAAAAESYQKAVDLSPNSAGLWSALGEALVMASDREPMPAAAAEAFDKAIKLNPKEARARYFIAVQRDLSGDHQGALNDWFALLADTPKNAPWEADLRRTIDQVAKIHKIDVSDRLKATTARAPTAAEIPVAARAIPGPTRQDMEAASQLPQGQQDAMISGMLESLENKIEADPKNVDQWIMLMRSRMSLGETNKAAKALADAIAANPEAAARLQSQAQLLGVPGS